MPAIRLRSLTAVYLAALYGVVGLTGGSIHYLATDLHGFFSNLRKVDSGGYYHFHAPDYHGHYHRHPSRGHHSHGRHSHASVVACHQNSEAVHGAIGESSEATYHSHACPLLSLVSTLKLSHASCCVATIIFDTIATPTTVASFIPALERALNSCPRGPPASAVA